jgi:hypothetical protein
MSLCPHGIRIEHMSCPDCADIARAELEAAERAHHEVYHERIPTGLVGPKKLDPRDIKIAAMNIVNHTLETADISAALRQAINDKCDEHAVAVITQLLKGK